MIYHKVQVLQKAETSFYVCVQDMFIMYAYDMHMISLNGICIVLYMAYIFVWYVYYASMI